MAITLIDQKQIRNFSSPTGVWYPTGWLVSGNMAISGLLSGISGYFDNLTVQNITVNGAVISPYLSGILGTTVTGSGIFMTLSPVDTSGNNIHFYHYIYTTNPASPIQRFSSQDSQTDWQIFNNGTWQAFPALGLNSAQQQTSLVKHVYKATGMDVFTKYFSEYSIIYAGNITGTPANSLEFQSPTQGYTVAHIPFLSEFFATADSRYARKAQIGSDFVLSGVKVSGLPLIVPTFSAIPATNHGTGTLVSVSGRLFVYDEVVGFSGYRPATPFTGFSTATGGVVSDINPIFSGDGQIGIRIVGNNIIAISGGGVNQFAIARQTFRQGSIIFSGGSGVQIQSGLTSSGVVIAINLSGNIAGGGGIGNVTGYGIDFSSPLFTGGFIVSGEGGIGVRLANLGSNISGIIISGAGGAGSVSGFGTNLLTPLFTGGVVVTGAGLVTTSLINLGNNISGILVSGATPPALVTGFGISASAPLFTGGFVISGAGGATVTMTNLGNNTSGIVVTSVLSDADHDQLFLEVWNQIGY